MHSSDLALERREKPPLPPTPVSHPKYRSTTDEIAALTNAENKAAIADAVKDVAQRFMEHPLTADDVRAVAREVMSAAAVRAARIEGSSARRTGQAE